MPVILKVLLNLWPFTPPAQEDDKCLAAVVLGAEHWVSKAHHKNINIKVKSFQGVLSHLYYPIYCLCKLHTSMALTCGYIIPKSSNTDGNRVEIKAPLQKHLQLPADTQKEWECISSFWKKKSNQKNTKSKTHHMNSCISHSSTLLSVPSHMESKVRYISLSGILCKTIGTPSSKKLILVGVESTHHLSDSGLWFCFYVLLWEIARGKWFNNLFI